MDQKQKIILFIIPIIIFLSIVMTELNLWRSIHLQNIWWMSKKLVPFTNLLAIYFCFRLYRAFNNPYFKLEGIALALNLVTAGLRILSDAVNTLCLIIELAGTLLALYALLKYREGWEQSKILSPIKRFYGLVPLAKNDWFWLVLLGFPIILYQLPMTDHSSASLTYIILLVFSVTGLSAQMLGLLICLAMVKSYRSQFFQYLVAVHIIPLGVVALSFLNVSLGLILNRSLESRLSVYFTYSQITINYILALHEVVVIGILVYAFLKYRESPKREGLMG